MNDITAYLVWIMDNGTDEKTEVFATVESVGQTEFFKAAQTGYNSEIRISVWNSEYDGQPIAEIEEKRFSIYRKFCRNDGKIELYLTEKIGV